MSLSLSRVYPITAVPNRHGWSHLDLARCFLAAGVGLFQIRGKEPQGAGRLFRQIETAVELAGPNSAAVMVNDRLDLALAAGAAGVHLGQDDLPVEAARRLAGRDLLIGLSTHNREQFDHAQELDVDYVALGPVFATPTKPGFNPPLGVETVARIVQRKRRPVVAIGGITLETAPLLWLAGVDAVAVISDIVEAEDPLQRIGQYLEAAGS
jgi:thiamine-phosphate pyrophosphorylase